MPPVLKFLTYNNAVPIAVSFMLLGAGGAFAATDPGAIYSSQQQVISVDNTYLVNKDLTSYKPKVEITGVTEDSDNYYVAYKLYTIDLQDYTWQDVVREETMQVSKADLGQYRDLGTYVTEKLKDVVGREYDRLVATQSDARSHVSQKVVATQYGGLIGKFLDPTTEELPGYTPVVQAPPPPQTTQVAAASESASNTASSPSVTSAPSAKIGLQLLGNDPAVIPLHTSYVDLGAVLIDPYGTNVGIHAFQNGKEVVTPTVDTSTSTAVTIEYRATDPNGVTVMVRRIVLVGGAADPGGEIPAAGYSPSAQQASTSPAPTATNTSSNTSNTASAPTNTPTSSQTTTSSSQTSTASSDTASSTSATSTTSGAASQTTSTSTSSSEASTTASVASTTAATVSATSTTETTSTTAASTTQTTDASSTTPAPSAQ